MKLAFNLCCVVVLLAIAGSPGFAEDKAPEASPSASAAPTAKKYACEMCKVPKDAPGKCECGMELKEIEDKKEEGKVEDGATPQPAK